MGEAVAHVLVVGAGIGGLTAAAALAQRGIETTVVELRAHEAESGVGIVQPGNALRALSSIGVVDACLAAGYQFEDWEWFDQDAQPTVTMPTGLASDGIPASNGISRRDLLEILRRAAVEAGAEIRYETTVERIEQEEAGGRPCHVTTSHGRAADHDLVVGFDGIRSAMRQQLFGTRGEPEYTGVTVWRLVAPRPASLTCGHLYQSPYSTVGLVPMSEDSMYLLHVTEEPGNPRHPADQFHTMLRDRLEGFGGLVADVRDQLDDPAAIVCSPIHTVALPPPWHDGRVVVCGDAAHASMPNLAQGAAMAIEDAVVLAELATGELPLDEALTAFTARRYPRCKFVQDISLLIADGQRSHNGEPRPTDVSDEDKVGFAALMAAELNKPC